MPAKLGNRIMGLIDYTDIVYTTSPLARDLSGNSSQRITATYRLYVRDIAVLGNGSLVIGIAGESKRRIG